MRDQAIHLTEFFEEFLFLFVSYVILMGIVFLLLKLISRTKPSPYSISAFLKLCLPGLFYALLESLADHQGLNILMIVPILAVSTVVLWRVNKKTWPLFGYTLALVLWWLMPNASLTLF